MIPAMKSCCVHLRRNSYNLDESTNVRNYLPKLKLGMENREVSDKNKISDRRTTSAQINQDNYSLRNNKQVNYSDDVKITEAESSDSDFSCDSISSDDEETTQKQKRRKTENLSITDPKQLSCLLCNKSFSNHSSYTRHKRSHESRPYKCRLCNKRFDYRQSFLNHMKKLHPEGEPFLCEYPGCEQSFKTQKLQENHHKMHWRYMCKYCKKLFARKHHMRKHILKIH